MSWRKKKLLICCVVFFILFILDFIPVKFAIKIKQFSDNNALNVYICEYSTATDGNWVATKEHNPWLSETIYFNLESNEIFGNISDIFKEGDEPITNLYVFGGTMRQEKVAENFTINILDVEKWNISYPIKRNTIRGLYAPKGYFTIYDYNLIKIIHDIFS